MSRVDILSISYEIALKWMPQDFTDDKSTMASSHYLGQCWPRSISPFDGARPQWVKGKQTIKTWNISRRLTSQIIKVGYWYLSTFQGGRNGLTHWGLVIPLCVSQHDHHRSRKCIDSFSLPNHYINPLRAKYFGGNINIYLHFMSFLHIDSTQVLKILPQGRPGPTYSA